MRGCHRPSWMACELIGKEIVRCQVSLPYDPCWTRLHQACARWEHALDSQRAIRVSLLFEGTMELVAMELKQSGYFLARTLSYEARQLLLLYNVTIQCPSNAVSGLQTSGLAVY